MSLIMRNEIADYLNVGDQDSESFVLMGTGFNTLDESPSAKTTEKTYISDKASRKTTTGYATVFAFDTDLISDQEAVMKLYDIGRNQIVGTDAELDYVRVELWNRVGVDGSKFKARKFKVGVEVSSISGAGGENVKVTGNLNAIGDFVDGEFDTSTKTFTEGSSEA